MPAIYLVSASSSDKGYRKIVGAEITWLFLHPKPTIKALQGEMKKFTHRRERASVSTRTR